MLNFPGNIETHLLLRLLLKNHTALFFLHPIIIGFLNVTKKETTNFLIAAIVLLAVSGSIGALDALGIATVTDYLIDIINNFTMLVSAAALVVSIKTILQIAKR